MPAGLNASRVVFGRPLSNRPMRSGGLRTSFGSAGPMTYPSVASVRLQRKHVIRAEPAVVLIVIFLGHDPAVAELRLKMERVGRRRRRAGRRSTTVARRCRRDGYTTGPIRCRSAGPCPSSVLNITRPSVSTTGCKAIATLRIADLLDVAFRSPRVVRVVHDEQLQAWAGMFRRAGRRCDCS